MPKNARTGVAYSISKHFVIWFAKTDARPLWCQRGALPQCDPRQL